MKKYYLMVLMLLCIIITPAQIRLVRDPGFGNSGSLDFSSLVGTQYGNILKIRYGNDGCFYLLTKISDQVDSYFTSEGTRYEGNQNWLFKIDRKGNRDASFAQEGILRLPEFFGEPDFQLTSDHGILVFFSYSLQNTAQNLDQQHFSLLKYHADGTPDKSYGTSGILAENVFYPEFSGLQKFPVNAFLYEDGSAVVEKYFPGEHPENSSITVRFDQNGKRDASFGKDGRLYGLRSDLVNTSFVQYQDHAVLSREEYQDGILLELRKFNGDFSKTIHTSSPGFSSERCLSDHSSSRLFRNLYIGGDSKKILTLYQESLFGENGNLQCRIKASLSVFNENLDLEKQFGNIGFADRISKKSFRGAVSCEGNYLVYGDDGIIAFSTSGQQLKINGETLLEQDADEIQIYGDILFIRKENRYSQYRITTEPLDVRETSGSSFRVQNPIDDRILIFADERFAAADLYEASGKFLLRSTQTEIPAMQLPRGVYILKIHTTKGNVFTTKLVK